MYYQQKLRNFLNYKFAYFLIFIYFFNYIFINIEIRFYELYTMFFRYIKLLLMRWKTRSIVFVVNDAAAAVGTINRQLTINIV